MPYVAKMRLPKLTTLLAACALFVVAGCGGTSESTDAGTDSTPTTTVENVESAVERAPAGNPCDDTRGPCEVVASVYVDGDGNSDNVGIELVDSLVSVRIDTGDGVSTASVEDKHVLRQDTTPSNVFVGAFRLTREQGADIVVDDRFGLGGAELFGVIGWEAGGPVVVPAPTGATYPEALPTEWAIPTERLRMLIRCPKPGSVGGVTTEGDISYGIPTPGGAWTLADTTRIAGSTKARTSSRKPGLSSAIPCTTRPGLCRDGVGPGSEPRPRGQSAAERERLRTDETDDRVLRRLPSGLVDNIVWDSWGGERATGRGEALYVVDSVAEAEMMPPDVVAFEIAICDGARAYPKLRWFFPEGRGVRPGAEQQRVLAPDGS